MIGFIPVSGYSRRLPGKNFRMLGDRVVANWTVDAAVRSLCFDEIILLTEPWHPIDHSSGPFRVRTRVPEDRVGGAWHAVAEHVDPGSDVTLLLPTSPFRDAQHIAEAMAIDAPKVASVQRVEHRKLRRQDYNLPDAVVPNSISQPLGKFYISTGGIQVWRDFMPDESFWDGIVAPYEITMPGALDIGTQEDWELAEVFAARIGR